MNSTKNNIQIFYFRFIDCHNQNPVFLRLNINVLNNNSFDNDNKFLTNAILTSKQI